MRKLLYIVLSLLLLASCVGQRRYDTSLRRVQILLNDAPDSALVLLDSMEAFSAGFSRGTRMHWLLLRLSAQNKCDTVFRSDSIQLALVDYFNRHGTPNERMTAHYLLGRAYSDMGESPLALRAYQVAVSCADTTSSDCDWWNLCRVYFNLSVLFYDHGMPKQLHWALEQAGVSAMKAGDTLSAIMAVNKMAQVYELTGDRDSLDLMACQAAQMFSSVGREDLAAQSLSWTIMDDLSKGLTKEAEVKIKMYEGKSGFFDEKHQIVSGKEIFYFTKGNYYLAVNMPDSAENIFRKLLQADEDINLRHAAYVGLRARYQYGGPTDSLVKYAILSEAYNDSLHQEEYVASLLRTQYSYDYSRQYEQALISKAESDRKGRIILEMVVAGVLFLLGLFLYYRYKRSQTRQRFQIFKEKLETLTHLNEEKEILIRKNQTAQEKIAAALQLKDQEIQEKTKQSDVVCKKMFNFVRVTSKIRIKRYKTEYL